MCVCVYVYICIYVYIYVYICIYMYINNVMSVELLVKNKLWTHGWEYITTANLTYTKQPPVGSVIDQRINIISCQRLTIV